MERSTFVLVLLRTRQMRRAECTTWSSALPRGNRAWTVLWEWAILSMTQICYPPPRPFIYLFCHVWVCACKCICLTISFYLFFLPTCSPLHHRSGISSLWSVWRYWLVTRARCCVCSMTRGSSSPARLTRLSGTHLILAPRGSKSARFLRGWSNMHRAWLSDGGRLVPSWTHKM